MSTAENPAVEDQDQELFPEDSGGGNRKPPLFPAVSPAAEEPSRRRSGFARKEWWDEVDPTTGLTNRENKSLEAKRMVQEGRIGGARPGAGRPRKNKSVAEVVTEKASEKADTIARELMSMVTHKSPSVKLGAIDRINKFEQDLEKNMRDDEKELRKLSGKSLDAALAEVLAEHGVGYDIELSPEDVEDDE